jgi:hypothetical protein
VTGSAPAWRTTLGELPIVRGGRWAVGGSASLALHGLPVDPRDLDLLVDHVAAAELVNALRGAVVSDEARWDRGDVRAARRALAVVHGVEIEILEGVETVGPTGDVVVATPDLDHVDQITVSGREIPVLPLSAMQVLLDATGNRERAAMVAKVLGGDRYQGCADLQARGQVCRPTGPRGQPARYQQQGRAACILQRPGWRRTAGSFRGTWRATASGPGRA